MFLMALLIMNRLAMLQQRVRAVWKKRENNGNRKVIETTIYKSIEACMHVKNNRMALLVISSVHTLSSAHHV
jgi:hypothetical protein